MIRQQTHPDQRSDPGKQAARLFDIFRKIVVLDGNQKLWTDDDGISYIGVIPFLMDESII